MRCCRMLVWGRTPKLDHSDGMRSFDRMRQTLFQLPPRAMVLLSLLSKGFGMPCSKRVKSTKLAPWLLMKMPFYFLYGAAPQELVQE